MDLFPRVFLLVFPQLAVGGFLCLSIPPFHDLQRGYYKSSTVVFLLLAALALIGRVLLWRGDGTAPAVGWMDPLEIALWAAFLVTGTGYFLTLWGERFAARARLFAATWVLGLIALILVGESYCPPEASWVTRLVYPASFITSALLLGSASTGMLLGHWYLIDRDLSLTPLHHILTFYLACLGTQAIIFLLTIVLLASAGGTSASASLHQLWRDHLPMLTARLLVSPLGAAGLGWMIWRTLQIPQTMAATGLFYIAILAVLVGEFMGRYLLFRTGLPL